MDLGHLSIKYKEQIKLLSLYKNESKIYRILIYFFLSLCIFLIVLISIESGWEIGLFLFPYGWASREISLRPINAFIFASSVIGFFLSDNMVNKIKNECSYNDIKFDYIHIYEALNSYNDFLESNVIIHKNKAIELIEKSFDEIEKWDYGNMNIISNEIKTQIDFIKNDLKYILFDMMSSSEIRIQKDAYNTLMNFLSLVYSHNKDSILQTGEKLQNYEIIEDISIHHSIKDILKTYIQNHEAISQLIFTSILLIGLHFFSQNIDASLKETIPWYIALLGISFPIFSWIKTTLLKIISS